MCWVGKSQLSPATIVHWSVNSLKGSRMMGQRVAASHCGSPCRIGCPFKIMDLQDQTHQGSTFSSRISSIKSWNTQTPLASKSTVSFALGSGNFHPDTPKKSAPMPIKASHLYLDIFQLGKVCFHFNLVKMMGL